MCRTPLGVVTLILALPLPSAAQVNIERLRGGEAQEGFSASVDVNVAARTGNVDVVQGGTELRLDRVGNTATFFVIGSANVGWQGGTRYLSDGLVHVRHVFRRGAAVRPEAFAQLDYHEPRGLLLRSLAGGGLRLRLARTATTQVAWGTAYMFEHERLDLPADATHPARVSTHRWSNYLSTRLTFTPQSTLTATVYAQPRFDFADVKVLGDASLGAHMSQSVSLVVTLHTHYDSDPPDGKERLDTVLSTGIQVGF